MTSDITILLICSIAATLIMVSLTIYLFVVFYKSKSRLQRQKMKLEQEVSKSSLEIREEFMRNVGKELHDNIGQVLSTAKLQLSMSEHNEANKESIGLIAQSINDIRNLSKVVDPDAVNNMGLVDSCRKEMERLNRLPHLSTFFMVNGKPCEFDPKEEIILFRILQESLNNSLKHSQTDRLDLSLSFEKSELIVNLKDYGVGFDNSVKKSTDGSGLRNMELRAEMIGASYKIESQVGKGTNIEIKYPKNNQYEQIPNRNSR